MSPTRRPCRAWESLHLRRGILKTSGVTPIFWQTVLTWLYWLAPVVAMMALAFYAWRHRTVPGATGIAWLMVGGALTSTAALLYRAGPRLGLPQIPLWEQIHLLGTVLVPLSSIAFAFQIGAQDPRRWRPGIAIICAAPLLVTVLIWNRDGAALLTRLPPGQLDAMAAWPQIQTAYAVALLLAGVPLVVQGVRYDPGMGRDRTAGVVAGLLVPVVAVLAYDPSASSLSMRLIAAFFGLVCIVAVWAILQHGLLDVVPIARSTVVENMADGVIVLDAERHLIDLNPAVRELLGLMTLRGLRMQYGRPAVEVFRNWPWLQAVCDGPNPMESEAIFDSPQGQRTCEVRASRLTDRAGRSAGRLIILRDITERKDAERQVARQQEALAMLEERERLAREFHDGLAQDLIALRMKIGLWEDAGNERMRGELQTLKALTTDSLREVRRAILALRPLALDEMGFVPALRQFTTDFAALNQLTVDLRIDGHTETLAAEWEPVLYRVLQEALSNVARHARASSVSVGLDLDNPVAVTLTVQDDGAGFDPASLPQALRGAHLGLTHMRERVEALQGHLAVNSQPGHGTEIVVTLPRAPHKGR